MPARVRRRRGALSQDDRHRWPRPRPWRASPSRRSTPPRATRSRSPWSAAAAAAPAPRRNALATKSGPIKLVAMADVFEDKLDDSYEELKDEHGDKVDVPDDRKFIGFDAYKKAMDCLKPGDVVILATPAGLPLGPLHLRDREGPERLHGEAGHRRRPDHPEDARPGRGGEEEEPEGRRRPDVPPLRGPRASCSSGSRTARSATSSCCGPIARPARSARPSPGPSPTTSAS